MPEVKVKTITYKPNGNKPEENSSGFDPLYGGEGDNLLIFPRDKIQNWWEEDTRRRPEGIMGVASARGDREYLLMVLSRYYTPRDLYYKTTDELNKILNLHLTETGGLI